jgi:hypothetical protein
VNVTAGRAVYKGGGASRPLCVCEMLARDAKKPCREEGAVEPYRERIENFLRRWRSRYEENRVLWVLAVPALVGAILVVMVWLSLGPAGTQTSVDRNDVVWACGRKVLPGYRGIPREARNDFAEARKDFAKGMRKDCGIYGPQAGD